MLRLSLFSRLTALGIVLAVFPLAQAKPLTDYVKTIVGTDAHGHAFPGATVPFGMVQLSPDTRTDTWDGSSGYHYSDSTIMGFSHTHLTGTGVGCLGDIMVMPTMGNLNLAPGTPGHGYISRFSHAQESARAGYYRVFLKDPGVLAELTATNRVGFHRYTFPASAQSNLVLDLVHGVSSEATETYLHIDGSQRLTGYRRSNGWGGQRTVYFAISLSKPYTSLTFKRSGAVVSPETSSAKGQVVAGLSFQTHKGEAIEVKVALSSTGIAGALKNLRTEAPGWNFDAVAKAADMEWNKTLAKVTAQSPDPHILSTFYTNVYLSCLAPSTYSNVDGSYWGMDKKIHPNPGFTTYTTFSLWDTHRALHPLMTIMDPKRDGEMVQTLLAEYRENGYHNLPVWPLMGNETWCMIGNHSIPVIVDAYFKGIRSFNAEAAYQAIRDTVMQRRNGLDSYQKLGWVASKSGDTATSRTLEFAVDDWCAARFADALGHHQDAQMFYKRAGNYRNLFDRTSRLFRGRHANGTWRRPFDTHGQVNDEYTEADAWQYAFYVPQDVPGLIDLYGGDQGFIQRLNTLFADNTKIHTDIPDITGLIGQYSQGDEQCHHVAYLYDYAGAPWLTQRMARQVMSEFFSDKPDGHCGNVDCGQMAAWYVLSAMGFYQVNPGLGVYAIGSPVVSKAVLQVGNHRTFTITAANNGPKNIYIQSATLNGKPLKRAWFTHEELVAGGSLHFVMGPTPNKAWGHASRVRPLATMPHGFAYASLPAPADDRPVTLSLPIRIVCGSDEEVQGFISDPNMLDGSTARSDASVDTSAANSAPAEVYDYERYSSDMTYRFPVPAGKTYTVRLHFAELFDSDKGERVENISLDGREVLKNFDILAEAGKVNKAVVHEYRNVLPDAHGVISIRVQATPNSPDQNAKISGIEIIPE